MAKHYYNDLGIIDYMPSEELLQQLKKQLPAADRITQRSTIMEQTAEILLWYYCRDLGETAPPPVNDILYQIFNDYISKGFLAQDFRLCAWNVCCMAQYREQYPK